MAALLALVHRALQPSPTLLRHTAGGMMQDAYELWQKWRRETQSPLAHEQGARIKGAAIFAKHDPRTWEAFERDVAGYDDWLSLGTEER